jgi:membrane fusion protein, multidrug efflux system
MRPLRMALFSGFLLVLIGAGCQKEAPAVAASDKTVVPVSRPVERAVTDYVDFTGRTDAVQSVNVVARATGYLVKTPFAEGADVKKGQLLFQIDPQPYQAQVDYGEAQVALNQSQLELSVQNFKRARDLAAQKGAEKGISQQEFDQYKAAWEQAVAQLNSAKASLEIYRLNLQYTRVTSPIDGQVSRYFLTTGNLVNQDQTLLTTVVSLDPIYAYFDVDQRTLLRIRRAINEGKIRSRRAELTAAPTFLPAKALAAAGLAVPAGAATMFPSVTALGLAVLDVLGPPVISVLLGLPGENQFPHQGTIDFANNQLNPTTGSISVRGVFANPKPPNGIRLMSPGMFVRIRLPIGPPHPALLVIDRAIQAEQGQKYLYVVNAQDQIEYRQVVTGALQDNGLRVISSGITADDWVVVGALQQVRPNMDVTRQPTPMPSFGATPTRR